MKGLFIFINLIIFNFIGCNHHIDTYEEFSVYRKIDDNTINILINKIDHKSYSFNSNLKIDIKTLEDHGDFFTDKDRVYYKYDLSDATLIMELEEVDRKSFQTFGNSIYAKDKYHVFDSRHGIVKDADVGTFRAIKIEFDGRIAYGKDKGNYFVWEKIVTDTVGFGKALEE